MYAYNYTYNRRKRCWQLYMICSTESVVVLESKHRGVVINAWYWLR